MKVGEGDGAAIGHDEREPAAIIRDQHAAACAADKLRPATAQRKIRHSERHVVAVAADVAHHDGNLANVPDCTFGEAGEIPRDRARRDLIDECDDIAFVRRVAEAGTQSRRTQRHAIQDIHEVIATGGIRAVKLRSEYAAALEVHRIKLH